MATVNETIGAKSQLGSGLALATETLSGNEAVSFTLYIKLVLPLDGYVFWVNSNLLNDSAIYNAMTCGLGEFNNSGSVVMPSKNINQKGSFHFSQETKQMEDRTASFNDVIFTSENLVQDFNLINPNALYIANYEGMRFSFSRKDNFYKQSDLYHYQGQALNSVMTTQIVDVMAGFDTDNVVVSNSLPIWLTLNQYFTLYPSYLVEQNINPPYASVDINPLNTVAIQAFPLIDINSNPYQLVKDVVKITMYGIRNNAALNFANYVFQYSLDTDAFGVQNMPVIQDEKLTQAEMGIIAQKKSITFEISYYQTTVNNITRQLIKSAFCTFNLV